MAKKKKGMTLLDWLFIVILLFGSIHIGLLGAFSFNLIEYLTQSIEWLYRTIYIIVGASALISIVILARKTKK